ncbi:MAG: DUF4340 domain-containing protein [Gammaproteobacteria bacterium]|nr:DUF4340 domain-containing protein [Gammaproteobacteria bacterium]
MKKNMIINITLAVAAFTLIVSIYLSRDQNPASTVQTKDFSFKSAPSVINITRLGESNVQLKLSPTGWLLNHNTIDKLWVRANHWKVEQIVNSPQNFAAIYVAPANTPEKYGMKNPIVTLTLGGLHVVFGDTDPIKKRRYVLIEESIYTINDDIYQHLISDYYSFIDNFVLPQTAKITGIDTQRYKLQQDKNGKWKSSFTNPSTADHIQKLLDEWSNLTALNVQKISEGLFKESVTIRFGDGTDIAIRVSQEEKQFRMQNLKTQFEYNINPETYQRLFPEKLN